MTASINRQEALHQFKLALKAGQKCYRDCVHRGRDPYPQVLAWIWASWRSRSPRSSG